MLSVIEIISSLQGEGKFTGNPTTFIRLHGCNENCRYCDARYTKEKRKKKMSLKTIMNYVNKMKNTYVCITGGEPLLQDDTLPLTYELVDNYYRVNIETNGSIPIESSYKRSFSYTMDIKCPSSGMCNRNRYSNLANLQTVDEVKFVVADEKDYLFAKNVIEKYPTFAPIIFSPVFGGDMGDTTKWARELSQKLLEDKIPNARLGMQIHKILDIY